MIYVALILHPQLGDVDALRRIGLDYLDDEEEEIEVEMVADPLENMETEAIMDEDLDMEILEVAL